MSEVRSTEGQVSLRVVDDFSFSMAGRHWSMLCGDVAFLYERGTSCARRDLLDAILQESITMQALCDGAIQKSRGGR